jgi:hypothetical protein
MLVNKAYADGDIVCFKLVTGDEIVAKIVNEHNGDYTVSRPCTVIPSQQGLGLMQSLISGNINTNVTLKSQHILMHSLVVPDIEAHYIKTTTGIEPVTRGKIIT